ncbi:MAG: transcriptional regulator [Bacilli bacterium]|jgi:transcriptional regulator with XRE-family HTH domain|nr:transcriptional regulator [Bacilli bacterium]
MAEKTIGQFIAERRKGLGLRQIDLGKRVNYSVQAISKMEKGLSQPAGALVPALCNALDISIDEFFAMERKPGKKNPVPPFDGLTFAENISYLRLKEGLSQYALALIIKVSKRSIANYERGVSVPSWEVVDAYLKHFGLTPGALYFTTLAPKAAAKTKIGGKIVWGSIGALAIAAIIVGVTSPFWMRRIENAAKGAYVADTACSSQETSSSSSEGSSVQVSSFDE